MNRLRVILPSVTVTYSAADRNAFGTPLLSAMPGRRA
jgi:hypothetical protein